MGLKRGTMLLSLGWAAQLVSGYAINIWLARIFGAEGLGLYGVTMSILMWVEIGLISGLPTAVQKFTASHPDEAGSIFRSASRMQIVSITVVFGVAFIVSPWFSRFLGDARLTGLIRIAIFDLWFYGLFFITLSLQNGLKRFGGQAFLIAFYAVTRLGFNILFVSIFHSMAGALIANIAASACGLGAGLIMARPLINPPVLTQKRNSDLVRFAWPLALNWLIIQLLLSVDLWFVKSRCEGVVSGYYYAAGILARTPYQLFFALSAILLPVISEAMSRHQIDVARRAIREAVRFLMMAALPLALMAHRFGKELLELLAKDLGPAATLLSILIWGMILLSVYFLFTMVLSADNRPRLVLGITLATVSCDILFNAIAVSRFGAIGASIATTSSILLGCSVLGVFVFKRFGGFLSGFSFCRILTASALVYGLSLVIPFQGLNVLLVLSVLGVLYALILILLGEMRREDWTWIVKVKA
jgi:O-antigen/teichoic acid export membrane protein